ncbi:MAG: NADH-quinone oxidoreductase subunit L [Candidatus Omnitrophica bacterium]|nr:NADH-quinone oxidoreductase subunit L [Candidatus Omnitrophota bacterium]
MNYYFILLAPFLAFVTIALFTRRFRSLSALMAIGGLGISFALILKLFLSLLTTGALPEPVEFSWLDLPGIHFGIGLLFDRLSILMGLLVSGVGTLIFIFSTGYMEDDPGYSRFFAYLSLFAVAMLGIVFSTNLIQTFLFWELVGLASYLLIGFWFEKNQAADAAKKAFMTNRVGDFGLMLGILLIWFVSGQALGSAEGRTVEFAQLARILPEGFASGTISGSVFFIAGLLIFCGVAGKSAQFPLHVWLPDAMEGPTPVSALIHAATMVAAGVYLMARIFFLFILSGELLQVVAAMGLLTALLGASLALMESDIKRVLAYSTMSQLGLMVMAMGLAYPVAGMYHLLTHGFFKALLFLGAGCVIHATHRQNIFELGGLFKRMPVTSMAFLMGMFALAGLFPFSGFFSKEEILQAALETSRFWFVGAEATTFLTAFYMGKLVWMVFLGHEKNHGETHEAPLVMTLPVMVLSFFSLAAGYFQIPELLGQASGETRTAHFGPVAFISTAVVLVGLFASFFLYGLKKPAYEPLEKRLGPLGRLFARKFFIDDLYNFYVAKIQQPFAELCDRANELFVIKGLGHLAGRGLYQLGSLMKKSLTGNVQTYISVVVVQILIILAVAAIFLQLV